MTDVVVTSNYRKVATLQVTPSVANISLVQPPKSVQVVSGDVFLQDPPSGAGTGLVFDLEHGLGYVATPNAGTNKIQMVFAPGTLFVQPGPDYQIPRSLRFRSSASANLTRTFTLPTIQNTYTLSMWVKRGKLGVVQYLLGASTNYNIGFNVSNQLVVTIAGSIYTSTAVFRDPSAWYHIVYSNSGTTYTVYVNNQTVLTGTSVANTVFNSAVAHQMGSANNASYTDGYLADVYFIDGQALTPSSFGQIDTLWGTWTAKAYTGTYGNNGFYLPFSNTSSVAALGYNYSGSSPGAWANGAVLPPTSQFPDSAPSDPYFANVVTLLQGENAFTDSSPASLTYTATGAVISTTQAKFGIGSLYVSATGGTKYLASPYTSTLALGTADYTIEMWVYFTTSAGTQYYAELADAASAQYIWFQYGPTANTLGCYVGGSQITGPICATDTWHHVAICRASGQASYYVNGLLINSNSNTTNYNTLMHLAIGAAPIISGGTSPGKGVYVDDIRITKGVARYLPNTSNWTPNNVSLTAGSTYDSMYDVPLGAGDSVGNGLGNYATLNAVLPTRSTLTNGNLTASGATDLPTVVPTSGNWYFEVDGVAKNWTPPAAFPAVAGNYNFGQQPFTYTPPAGYKALHTGNLPEPTIKKPNQYFDAVTYTGSGGQVNITSEFPDSAPADPNFASVSYLCHFNASFADVKSNTWTATGSPTISTADSKYGGGALSVSPSNYLTAPSAAMSSGTTDFTLEFWIKPTLSPNFGVVFSTLDAGHTNGLLFQFNSDGTVESKQYESGGQTSWVAPTSAGAIVANTWQHVAWSRSGTTTRFFVNGGLLSTTTANTVSIIHAAPLQLGGPGFGANQTTFLVDDLRVTNGVGRYTANFQGGQTITNPGAFQPDLVWIKSRSASTDNKLTDSVRGATKSVSTNASVAEATDAGGVTAFNADGFTLGSDTNYNTSAETYVAWQWKESITSGFDIVTYTGTGANRTVAHNLGIAPKVMLLEPLTTANGTLYHEAFGPSGGFNTTAPTSGSVSATLWGSTAPTSAVFSLGTSAATNGIGVGMVAYLFAEVPGFSSLSSFVGNGSADGVFVYCGFRPRYVMFKMSTAASLWYTYDSARNTTNAATGILTFNATTTEGTGVAIDILSNGFKIRTATGSGITYIYMAFAENPFKYSLAR